MPKLDCVVIGYNEGSFDDYRLMCERAGPRTPESQIYRKEHLVIEGRPRPWMESFSVLRRAVTGRPDRYHVGEVANLAAIYLTSFLRSNGLAAEPVPMFSADQERLEALLGERPAVVAITTTFYVNVLPVVPIVEFIREHSPTSHIVIGGPLIDNLSRAGLDNVAQDLLTAMGSDSYVQESQGERTLVNLCRAIRAGGSLAKVDNLILRIDDQWVSNRRVPENNDLDEAAIDWAGFDPELIGVTAQTRTARSCAFKCSFCDYPTRAGALRTASCETVRHELRAMARAGVQNVVFIDDTFNVPPKRFKELCRMMIEEDLGLHWYSYFRCSNARDEETFDLAAESGCSGVFLGIESGDSTILANMNKLAQDDQYRVGINRLKERGIATFASIIVGFPGETEQTVANTIAFLNETAPDFWRAQAWWANPMSPVFQRRAELEISGKGYRWSHRTMSSTVAADLADRMFEQVTESVWLPLYDLDFWSLPYLSGKGVDIRELKPLLRVSQQIMRLRDGVKATDGAQLAAAERVLADAVANLDVRSSRFTL